NVQKRSIKNYQYGFVFFDTETKYLYRIVQTGLPEVDQKGNHFSNADKATHILRMNIETKTFNEYKLASSQYFIPNDWSYNKYNKNLLYTKLIQDAKNKKICYFNFHTFSLLDF